ncbi:hypothetical protein [Lacticaseibacillus brantae]|uniref:hypothetical protein n=1 Tax=Lacticaseibacillus brantae TaxID=943673 RepID=UPI00070DD484|nr:hypothetical protein [Lacticaseibacillus brantae]
MQTTEKISWTSRGWLGFFAIIYAVLLVIGAVSCAFMLTVGTPDKTSDFVSSGPALTQISKNINHQLTTTVQKAGLKVNDAKLLSEGEVQRLLRQGFNKSMNDNLTINLKPAEQMITQNLGAATVKPVPAPVTKAIHQDLSKGVDSYFQGGLGVVYPLFVLMTQTGTIVAGILIVIVWFFMGLTSHKLWRWLLVVGRTTYFIGFLGGIAALLVGIEQITTRLVGSWADGDILTLVVVHFAPTWQHVAGVVIVLGLLLAAISYLVRRKDLIQE